MFCNCVICVTNADRSCEYVFIAQCQCTFAAWQVVDTRYEHVAKNVLD
eukprot:COSAG02_NODE_7545_length_2968_cov_1.526316_4_plen_48_part_00